MEKGPVLVIDDEPDFREMVSSVLTKAGFRVLAAPDGPQGIVMARASQPAVILVDMLMPDMDGIETCERLKLDPGLEDIPLVGVTGSTDLTYTEKAFRAGVRFFLPKPSGVESLLQVVELAADSGRADSAMRHVRRHPRFSADLPVSCSVQGEGGTRREVMGHTQNMGLGGLLLWLPELVEIDTVLRLCLGLAEGPITADGTVIWHDPQVTSEGKVPHGIRILRFREDADLERYRRFLGELPVEAGH